MAAKLVLLCRCATTVDAAIARTQLAHAGISAFLENETLVGNFAYLSGAVGGVKLLVPDTAVDHALEVLRAYAEARSQAEEESHQNLPWKCPRCDAAVDAGFDACWSCGTLCSGEVDPTFDEVAADGRDPSRHAHFTSFSESESIRSEPSVDPPLPNYPRDDGNPYRAPIDRLPIRVAARSPDWTPEDASAGDELVRRAWRGAVIGVFLCPPLLNLHSIWLLCLLTIRGLPVSPRGSRLYVLAWLVNLAVSVVAIVVFAQLATSISGGR